LPAPEAASVPSDDTHQQQVLEAALQKLPAAQRVPLVLYHFEQMSYEDIARQLGISLGKVKTDIHRGREALRQKLRLTPQGDVVTVFSPPRTTPPGARLMLGCVL
ncbi:MAG TPA: sigma-70 family RNA polymerase sigma factor, partial [Verrucomicrobiae bacterium]|nr:sigma-70 family RNA polymerase sigma factor [Verrucomicrobiae bacterium]